MSEYPFVSVIVPVYNGEKIIAETIERLQQLDYPKDRFEIIIVDNNSPDQTKKVVEQYPVKYILEDEHQCPAAARNRGATIAKGEILAFIDADQRADPRWLPEMIKPFTNPKVGATGGKSLPQAEQNENIVTEYQLDEWDTTYWPEAEQSEKFYKIGGGNSAVRRELFDKLNGFDATMFSSEDFDFYYRLTHQLNYRIQMCEGAILLNKLRMTKEALWKREFRIGFGDVLFNRKHGFNQISVLTNFFKAILRTIFGWLSMLKTLFSHLPNEHKQRKIQKIDLDISLKWAWWLGQVNQLFKFMRGDVPPEW